MLSTATLLRYKLSHVGRILDTARHIKFLIFGGTLRSQIIFHSLPSSPAHECSASTPCFSRRATWYADLTENSCFLFSFHINVSLCRSLLSGMAIISSHVFVAINLEFGIIFFSVTQFNMHSNSMLLIIIIIIIIVIVIIII